MNEMLKKFWTEEEGGEAVEWPLIVALVVIAALGTWGALGDEIQAALQAIVDAFGEAGVGA